MQPENVEPENVVETGVDWKRVARGLHWLGFGAFLLLTTLGVLPWSFWVRAAEYWPVLLIALGLRLMLTRRAPWMALISPVVILGTLGLLAITDGGPLGGDWRPVRVARSQAAERWLLEADLAFTRLDVTAAGLDPSLLATGRALVRDDDDPVTVAGETVPRLRLAGPHRHLHIMVGPPPRQAFEIEVTDAIPVRLDLDLAFTAGRIDLSRGALLGAAFDGAFNDATLQLPVPRDEVRLDYEGAFSNLEIVVPDEVPVGVSTDGFLNWVDGRPRRDRTGPGYQLRVDGAFNRVVVRGE